MNSDSHILNIFKYAHLPAYSLMLEDKSLDFQSILNFLYSTNRNIASMFEIAFGTPRLVLFLG